MEINPLLSIQILCLSFLAILFLQSGIDKVIHYKGNLDWLTGHFSKSPLKGVVGIIFPLITLLEVAAGVFSLLGILFLFLSGDASMGIIGAQLSSVSIVALFLGQRLAQDYAGAATLTTYFLITIVAIYILSV